MASFAVQFHEFQIWECWLSLAGSFCIREIISIKTGNNLCCFSSFVSIITGVKGLLDFFLASVLFLLLWLLKAFRIQSLDDCLTVSSQLTYNPAGILDRVCFIIVKAPGRSWGLLGVCNDTGQKCESHSFHSPSSCGIHGWGGGRGVWSEGLRLSLGRKEAGEKWFWLCDFVWFFCHPMLVLIIS